MERVHGTKYRQRLPLHAEHCYRSSEPCGRHLHQRHRLFTWNTEPTRPLPGRDRPAQRVGRDNIHRRYFDNPVQRFSTPSGYRCVPNSLKRASLPLSNSPFFFSLQILLDSGRAGSVEPVSFKFAFPCALYDGVVMVGLAGFEPAISWVPGVIEHSQATRIVRTHRGYPGPLDLAIRQPLAASKVRCCFSSYPSRSSSSTLLFLTKRLTEVIYAFVIFAEYMAGSIVRPCRSWLVRGMPVLYRDLSTIYSTNEGIRDQRHTVRTTWLSTRKSSRHASSANASS